MVFDRAPRDLNIIERDGVIGELLITLVPFACDQHNVARLRQRNGAANRRHSIDNFLDRKSTRLNSSHSQISYAVFCLKKKKTTHSTRNARSTPATTSAPRSASAYTAAATCSPTRR